MPASTGTGGGALPSSRPVSSLSIADLFVQSIVGETASNYFYSTSLDSNDPAAAVSISPDGDNRRGRYYRHRLSKELPESKADIMTMKEGGGGRSSGSSSKSALRRAKSASFRLVRLASGSSRWGDRARSRLQEEDEYRKQTTDDGGGDEQSRLLLANSAAVGNTVAPASGKRYGITLTTPEQATSRWRSRRHLTLLKLKICDWSVLVTLISLLLAIVDVEVCAAAARKPLDDRIISDAVSLTLRLFVMALTVALQLLLVTYHWTDIKIYLVETGSESWRLGVTGDRLAKVAIELAVCAICPLPGTGFVDWSLLGRRAGARVQIPWHVLLCLPMFLRLYLLCRYVVLHSIQYQDSATRTIASLNHITVDFPFVVKSQLYERPLQIVCVATICFWTVMGWMLAQCERHVAPSLPGTQHLLDFIWFEIITFFSIGYGDIQVFTHCGRALAMLTAIVGTLFSSLLIALVGRRMSLSLAERRVNHLVAESQLINVHRHAAARVLQHTWRTVQRRRHWQMRPTSRNTFTLHAAQRRLLAAIFEFRRCRWRLRLQQEEEDDFFALKRSLTETEDRLARVRQRQQQMHANLQRLNSHVHALSAVIELRKGEADLGGTATLCAAPPPLAPPPPTYRRAPPLRTTEYSIDESIASVA